MNKAEVVEALALKANMTKSDAEKVLNAFINIVGDELAKGEKVTLKGFGIFDVHKRKERSGRNPKSGETITIPATKTPTFKASTTLKNKINK